MARIGPRHEYHRPRSMVRRLLLLAAAVLLAGVI
jgi:hypothetical protein